MNLAGKAACVRIGSSTTALPEQSIEHFHWLANIMREQLVDAVTHQALPQGGKTVGSCLSSLQ